MGEDMKATEETEEIENFDIESVIAVRLLDPDLIVPNAPPMTKQEERQLSRRLRDAKNKAYDKKNRPKNATAEAYYMSVRDEYALALMHIPTQIAIMYSPQCQGGMMYNDLMNSGIIGLMHALDKHEFRDLVSICRRQDKICKQCGYRTTSTKGICPKCQHDEWKPGKKLCNKIIRKPDVKICPKCGYQMGSPVFSGLAKKAVKHEVQGFLDNNSRVIRRPSAQVLEITERKYGDRGDVYAIAARTKYSVPEIIEVLAPIASLNSTVDEDGIPLSEIIVTSGVDTGVDARRREHIERALGCIHEWDGDPGRMANIMRDFFFANMSFNELAKTYNFTKQRSREMLKKIAAQLRTSKEARPHLAKALRVGSTINEDMTDEEWMTIWLAQDDVT